MARMEELSHCVALTERQAKALLNLVTLGNSVYSRLVVAQGPPSELLTADEMQDLQARLEVALREDER